MLADASPSRTRGAMYGADVTPPLHNVAVIWERFGQENYRLGRPMREFVLGTNEATIRGAVEAAIIEWAMEPAE